MNETTTAAADTYPAFTFLGTTDDCTTCDCCGRQNLKLTVVILPDGAVDPLYYGTTCAAHALKRTVKEIKAGARAADDARAAAERAERDRQHAEFSARWDAHIAAELARAGKRSAGDRFRDLEQLGGYAAVRASFDDATA